jgi:hypothetical protein
VGEGSHPVSLFGPSIGAYREAVYGMGDRTPARLAVAASVGLALNLSDGEAIAAVDAVIPFGGEALLDSDLGLAIVRTDALERLAALKSTRAA